MNEAAGFALVTAAWVDQDVRPEVGNMVVDLILDADVGELHGPRPGDVGLLQRADGGSNGCQRCAGASAFPGAGQIFQHHARAAPKTRLFCPSTHVNHVADGPRYKLIGRETQGKEQAR